MQGTTVTVVLTAPVTLTSVADAIGKGEQATEASLKEAGLALCRLDRRLTDGLGLEAVDGALRSDAITLALPEFQFTPWADATKRLNGSLYVDPGPGTTGCVYGGIGLGARLRTLSHLGEEFVEVTLRLLPKERGNKVPEVSLIQAVEVLRAGGMSNTGVITILSALFRAPGVEDPGLAVRESLLGKALAATAADNGAGTQLAEDARAFASVG